MSTPVTTEAALQALHTPDRVEPTPTPETPAPPAPPPAEVPLNIEDDAAVDAALAANEIQVPDGDALIAKSDAGKIAQHYRGKLKEVKAELEATRAGSAKIPALEQQIAQLQATVQQLQPYVQAYQQAQQQAPPQAPQAPAISDAEAERYARRYDLYKMDGSGALDLDRGREILTDIRQEAASAAEAAAEKRVAPIYQDNALRASANFVARAKNTVLPNGLSVPQDTMDLIANRIGPELTATQEGAQWAMLTALGASMAMATPEQLAVIVQQASTRARQRGPNGQFLTAAAAPQAPIPDPVPREPSGGQPPQAVSALSEQERKFIQATGMSEADYIKTAGPRFGGRS